ncbi:MAG: hypothetical protein FJ303_27495 [Planctomycetes bacterium]|nr:hypothetical protein [Planctomycetota bacterium]
MDRTNTARMVLIGAVLVVGGAIAVWYWPPPATNGEVADNGGGGLGRPRTELVTRSKFSTIKITREGQVRTLWFVRDNNEEVIESQVNLDSPYDLLISYTRYMFMSYAFRPKQEKVLIVGLGGGAMVHFMKAYDPKCKVDCVEIDPKIVEVADKYFGVRSDDNVKIITEDAFEYFKRTEAKYDVIYMDAFLKPSSKTDSTGVPLRLKTIQFYRDLQKKLTPDGMVVFNINGHDEMESDVKNIRDAFPQAYAFVLPRFGGLVVVGSMTEKRLPFETIVRDSAELDRRFRASFSFELIARTMRQR